MLGMGARTACGSLGQLLNMRWRKWAQRVRAEQDCSGNMVQMCQLTKKVCACGSLEAIWRPGVHPAEQSRAAGRCCVSDILRAKCLIAAVCKVGFCKLHAVRVCQLLYSCFIPALSP